MNLRSKKGNAVIDSIMYILVITVFAALGIICYKVINDLNTEVQADDDMNTNAKTASATLNTNFPKFMDAGFVILVILMWALVIVASFNIDAHPIFMVFAILLMAFVLFIGAAMSNFYTELTDDDDLGSVSDSFPKTNWIMDHLLHLVLVVVASVIIVLYGKNRYAG